MTTKHTHIALAIGAILLGCMLNCLSMEAIVSTDRGCGNLVTMAQFLFVALTGLPSHVDRHFRIRLRIPLRFYAILVSIFSCTAVLINIVYTYQISTPLHMIFRSGSLLSSMLIGMAFFRKQYTKLQVLSVCVVTLAILLATLCEHHHDEHPPNTNSTSEQWWVGVLLLSLALVCTSLLGHIQEIVYAECPNTSHECMTFSHLFGLIYFFLVLDDVLLHVRAFNLSKQFVLGPIGIPFLWILLAVNTVTQFICIWGVYRLTALTSTLTCTFTITIRKFLSLIASVHYFHHHFSAWHWLASVLVFSGTFTYALSSRRDSPHENENNTGQHDPNNKKGQ